MDELTPIVQADDVEAFRTWLSVNPELTADAFGAAVVFFSPRIAEIVVDTLSQVKSNNTIWHDAVAHNIHSNFWWPLMERKAQEHNFQPWTVLNDKGQSMLHIALHGSNRSTIWRLLQLGPSMIDIQSADGSTPLHVAVAYQSVEMVVAMVELGCRSLSVPNKWGRRPMRYADVYNKEDSFFYLVGLDGIESVLEDFKTNSEWVPRSFTRDTINACRDSADFKPNEYERYRTYTSEQTILDRRYRVYFQIPLVYRLCLLV